jgi:hypothetical protein
MDTTQYCSCGDAALGATNRCARCAALDVLELNANAGESEIKEAYRVLVKVWHPDRFQTDKKLRAAAEEKLKALNTAYVFLTERASRPTRRQPAGQSYRAEAASRPSARPRPTGAPKRQRAQRAGRRRRLMPSSTVLVSLGALACAVLIAALVLGAMDSTLASDPTVGGFYSQMRYGVVTRFRQAAGAIWSSAGQRLQDIAPHRSEPVAAVNPQPADPLQPVNQTVNQPEATDRIPTQSAHRRELGAAQAAPAKLMPYVTVGLTRDEVTAIAGAPTAAADDKLLYPGSEIDFTAGKVSGWKIDPASTPIRVKLWPDASVDPDLDSFGVGSSKNVVLVVQGTPTYFSQSRFGYGGSVVYFENGAVVGWKVDPAWPLHTAGH